MKKIICSLKVFTSIFLLFQLCILFNANASEQISFKNLVGTWISKGFIGTGELILQKGGSYIFNIKDSNGKVFISENGIWKVEENVLLRKCDYILMYMASGNVDRKPPENKDWTRSTIVELTKNEFRASSEKEKSVGTWTRINPSEKKEKK
jgi:hypothetical protein